MKKTMLAAVQFEPLPGNTEKNLAEICRYMEAAAEKGAELICFPEASLTGYRTQAPEEIAISAEDESFCVLKEKAAELSLAVCSGFIEKGEKPHITQFLTDGRKTLFYRKVHLGCRERESFAAGNELPVGVFAGICVGIQLCWESHIPDISTVFRRKGAELLLVPYATGMSGETCRDVWMRHLPARAGDNGTFLAACNAFLNVAENSPQAGQPEDAACLRCTRKGGGLLFLDPKGRTLAEDFSPENKLLLREIGGSLPRELPDGNMGNISYFDRRREELYH